MSYDDWKLKTPPTYGAIPKRKKKEKLNPKYEIYLKNLLNEHKKKQSGKGL